MHEPTRHSRHAAIVSGRSVSHDVRRARWWSLAPSLVLGALLFVAGCSSTVPPSGPPNEPPIADADPPVADPDPTAPSPGTYVISLTPPAEVVLSGTVVEFVATFVPDYDGELLWTASAGSLVTDGPRARVSVPAGIETLSVVVARASAPAESAVADVEVRTGLTEPFAIVVLPDTQNMVQYEERAPLFDAMIDWIVDARDERRIEFVTHTGDVVAWADREAEWSRARAALDRLHGVVPYSVALGDHEYDPEEYKDGSVENYLAHFGPQRYAGMDWYLGAHADGLSHLQTFTAGGRTFLHLAVEWEPLGTIDDATSPLGWARAVLEAHPDVPTIVTTHAYLWDRPSEEGHFRWRGRDAFVYADDGRTKRYVGPTGEELFAALVEPFPQVFMVLGGHFHLAPLPDQGRVHQVSTNAAGLEVFEMLANFQSWPNGGDGWLRTIDFLPGGGARGSDRITVETYSPWRAQAGLVAYQTDPAGSFSFDLDFDARFGPSE